MASSGCTDHPAAQQNSTPKLPVRPTGEIALPGDSSRFDYASLDPRRGLLFVAHLGASEVVEVDVGAEKVVRTIPDLSQVHGVLVVSTTNRVYATATGTNEVVAINEDTGEVLGRASTGAYPDGLAYDSRRNTIWTTNETAGSESVFDATTLQPRGTVEVGGEVGNVGYDPKGDRILVSVQGKNDLAVVDPGSMKVTHSGGLRCPQSGTGAGGAGSTCRQRACCRGRPDNPPQLLPDPDGNWWQTRSVRGRIGLTR
jgi:DNA-binding beta-propeller fold protein YncE